MRLKKSSGVSWKGVLKQASKTFFFNSASIKYFCKGVQKICSSKVRAKQNVYEVFCPLIFYFEKKAHKMRWKTWLWFLTKFLRSESMRFIKQEVQLFQKKMIEILNLFAIVNYDFFQNWRFFLHASVQANLLSGAIILNAKN